MGPRRWILSAVLMLGVGLAPPAVVAADPDSGATVGFGNEDTGSPFPPPTGHDAVLINEAGHLRRIGSSSVAKYTDAAFKISFALRSSRFSRSNSLSRCRSPLVNQSRRSPRSARSCRTHVRNASGCTPRSWATCAIGRPTQTQAGSRAHATRSDNSSLWPSLDALPSPGQNLGTEPPSNPGWLDSFCWSF